MLNFNLKTLGTDWRRLINEFSQLPYLSQMKCHEDDVDLLDVEISFEEVLNMLIPQWIFEVHFRNENELFWFQKDIPVAYTALWTVARKYIIFSHLGIWWKNLNTLNRRALRWSVSKLTRRILAINYQNTRFITLI